MYLMYDKRGLTPTEYNSLITPADKEILKAFITFDINKRKQAENSE